MKRRVLVLGTTGLDKMDVLERVQKADHGQTLEVVNFRDSLKRGTIVKEFSSYLSSGLYEQAKDREEAWPGFREAIEEADQRSDGLLICMHATLVRHFYGVRMALDVGDVCETVKPDLIVTLIDDVYAAWTRTEDRAGGEDDEFGRPTLEQLISARRSEAMVGDAIAAKMAATHKKHVRHVVLSINHPVSTLVNLIVFDAVPVYLSFPISAPRDAAAAEDLRLVKKVNAFHEKAIAVQHANKNVAFISPLAIDELPLVKAAKKPIEDRAKELQAAEDKVNFAGMKLKEDPDNEALQSGLNAAKEELSARRAHRYTFPFSLTELRWPLDALFPGEQRLHTQPTDTEIPVVQADHVRGAIASDVGWRDNRLVLQADALVVFCPVMPRKEKSRLARGVRAELIRAVSSKLSSFVYQDPDLDPEEKWLDFVGRDTGSMGMDPHHVYIKSTESVDALFNKLLDYLKRRRA